MTLWLATLALLMPQVPIGPVEDRVAMTEVNHFFDDDARPIFTQVIFWEWDHDQHRFRVVAWRMLKSVEGETATPHGLWPRKVHGGFESLWQDGEVLRKVRANVYHQTWTQYDPELRDRNHHPKGQRRGLSKPYPVETTSNTSPGDLLP